MSEQHNNEHPEGEIAKVIRSLTTRERELLGHRIGTTGQYITSLMYKGVGRRNIALLIELHKITGGAMDCIDAISEVYRHAVDWDFVRTLLNERAEAKDSAEFAAAIDKIATDAAAGEMVPA